MARSDRVTPAERDGIGVAGCDRMGAPMLAALRALDHDAWGFDIRPPADFGPLAPAMTDDLADFAQDLRTLITVVATSTRPRRCCSAGRTF